MAMDVAPLHTIPSSLYNAVISRIQQIQARIDGDSRLLLNRGNELAASAVGAINRIATSLSDPVWPTEPQASPLVPPPAYTPPAIDLSGHVDVPKMAKIPDFVSKLGDLKIPNITIPPVPGQVPNVVLPVSPSVTMPTAPSQPSVDLNVAIPTAPGLSLPTAPTIHGVTLPTLPTINIPDLNVTPPEWVEPRQYVPEDISRKMGTVTVDDSLLKEFAQRALRETPYALVTASEQEVQRQADLINSQADKDAREVWDEFSSRGFTAPPGTVGKRVDAIRADAAAKVRQASRDVAFERLKIEVQAYQTNMQAGVELAKKQIDKDLEKARLMLDIYTATARQMIDMYNASVEVFKARQLGFQALIEVFKARIEGELAKVKLYQAQIDGQKTLVEAEVAQMQGYEAQVRGLLAVVEIFKAQVAAAQTEMEMKAKRIDVFRSEVEAYVAGINAVKAQYEAYETQTRAAIAPVTVYEAQMRGYAAQVDGVKAQVDIYKTQTDAEVAKEDARIKAYIANVDMAVKSADVAVESGKLEAQIIRTALDVQVAQAQASSDTYRAQIEAYKAEIHQSLAQFEAAIKKWEVIYQSQLKRADLRLEATKGAAQIASQLAASALAGFHVQAGLNGGAQLSMQGQSAGHWNYQYNEQHQFKGGE